MSTFTKNSITMKGAVAIAALVAGGRLEFTKISVGDGTIPAGQTAMTMTDLANRLFDVDIQEVYSDSESQATVTGVFSNSQTQTGFYYRELGLFAKDPATGAEILFCYGNAEDEAEWISPAGEESVIEKEVHIVTLVGNATEVTATIKSGIYPTIGQMDKALSLKADLDATAAEGGRVLASQMRFDASQTLYVDAAASATGADGSESKPFKTIQAAINARYMGAPVVYIKIKAGKYNEDVKTPRAPNTTWRFTREGSGTVSVKTMLIDNAAYAYFNGVTMAGPAVSDTPIFFAANTPCVYIDGMTVNGTTNDTGINFSASRGVIKNSQINNCGIALAAIEGSFINAQSVNGSGNTRGVFADNAIAILTNWGLSATTPFDITNGGAINTDGAASTYPSSQGHLYSLGGFTETAALKTRLLQEFSKLKEGDFKGFQFWNNIVGNFGIFISSQTMHVWMHKTSNDEGGYGVAVFYAHRDAGAAYMHIVNGAFVDDTPKKFADPADLAKYLPLAGGAMVGMIETTGGQNFPALSHVNSGGQLWLFDKDDQLYKGGFIVRAKGSDGQYHDLEGRADGRLMWDGKHVVRSVNGYNATETGAVTIPVATATTYGIMKTATDDTVVDPDEDEAAITPAVYHDVSDFRHKSTAYKVGDKVECMFNFELFLECTKAGTTGTGALDTRSVKHGEVITDGSVQWTVRTHIRSIGGQFPDATGNVSLDLDDYAFDSEVVHKEGSETITGQKTFGNSLKFNTNFWLTGQRNDVSVGDESRDTSKNVIVYRITDKDGTALMSEEMYLNSDGSRDLRFNGRNRANTGWRLFLTIKEYANEEVRLIAADSPSASVNDHTLVTAKWVDNKIKSSTDIVHTTGNETVNGKKTFGRELTVTGSTGYEIQRTDQDLKVLPTGTVQTWFARHKDKNNKSGLLMKHYQYADGRTEVTLSDINHYNIDGNDDSDGDWCSLSIGHNADGSRYIRGVYDPDKTISGYELIHAKWLRAYIWDDERSQIVHTVNTQTIDGKKTFLQTPIVSANPMLRSEYWSDISIADTSRAMTKTKMLAEVLDKDGKRWMGLETTANTIGQRQVQLIGRNRNDSNWINFIKFIEDTDGSVTGYLANNTPSEASANEVATAGFVHDTIKSVVLDTFFPIGSIYMDATGNVNPNTQFGGTWAKIENRFLLASGTKSVGATGGEEKVTLTTAQMPKHNHGGRNDINITGTIAAGGQTMNPTLSGAFYNTNTAHDTAGDGHDSTTVAGFDASKSWTGSTGSAGSGQAHNNMPPYQVVAVWKRTA